MKKPTVPICPHCEGRGVVRTSKAKLAKKLLDQGVHPDEIEEAINEIAAKAQATQKRKQH